MQSEKDNYLYKAYWGSVERFQRSNDIWLYGSLLISLGWMPFLAPILDNADPLFAQVMTPGFYLHHIEVGDKNPPSATIYANI